MKSAAALATLLVATSAAADAVPQAAPQVTPQSDHVWYGWQPLLGDLAGAGIFIAGAARGNAGIEIVGVLVFPVAAPVIHLEHGHPYRALGSLVLRVGAPVGGLFLGAQVEGRNCTRSDEGPCGLAGAVLGSLIGLLTAVVIDDGLLSWDEKPAPGFVERLTPSIAVRGNRGLLALRGTF